MEYLSRYTHRTAIGNERIRAVTDSAVVFTVRADNQGGKMKVRLPGADFVRRVLLHVLPTGIKRIRHYGVLAAACKGKKLDAARADLQMPAPNPRAMESARDFLKRVARIDALHCPCCKTGQLRCVQTLAGVEVAAWPHGRTGAAQPGAALSGEASMRGNAPPRRCGPAVARAGAQARPTRSLCAGRNASGLLARHAPDGGCRAQPSCP